MQIKVVERVMQVAKEREERIFLISRRSSNEKSRVDWSRLKYAKAVIKQSRGFPVEMLSVSVGEISTKHNGYLEFWVGSSLELELYVTRNRLICLMTPVQTD